MKKFNTTRVGKFFKQLTNYLKARRENAEEAAALLQQHAPEPDLLAKDSELLAVDFAEAPAPRPRFNILNAALLLKNSVYESMTGGVPPRTSVFNKGVIPLQANQVWPGSFPYALIMLDINGRRGQGQDYYLRGYAHAVIRRMLWSCVPEPVLGVNPDALAADCSYYLGILRDTSTQWPGKEFATDQFSDLTSLLEVLFNSVRTDLVRAALVVSAPERKDAFDLRVSGDLDRAQTFITGILLNIGLLVEIYVSVNGGRHDE